MSLRLFLRILSISRAHDLIMFKQALQDFHSRISSAIDSGYLIDESGNHVNIYKTEDGFNHLCNVIQGNADSVNKEYYHSVEYLYRKILGFAPEPANKYHVVPTSLHFVSTSMRDPAFYGIYKNIVNYWIRYATLCERIQSPGKFNFYK